ncbi:MAG TPA: TetR/AcrR family transcriptional regulator [Solirubrobacterales bacterium]|nr:TetR/AcrR family transcriptional regulator [Solirubrobacterales bacterium]
MIETGPLFGKLSPGPGMSPQQVASHQRARIHSAMIVLVAERGYSAATVRELAQLAGVSTRAFYEHFGGKEECFLHTYELAARRTAMRIIESVRGERDWLERLRLGFEEFAAEIEREPQAARVALVEVLAGGISALRKMRSVEGIFEAMIGESFARSSGGAKMPALVLQGIVSGTARVVRDRLLDGQEEELPSLAGDLMEWALSYRWESIGILDRLDSRPAARSIAAEYATADPGKGAEPMDDRALILSAISKLTVADGYEALTVPRIRAAAGVSRRAFDALYDGVDDCLLAALELRTGEALAKVVPAHTAGKTWSGGVYRAVAALCAHIAQDASFAKLAFIDAFAPGPVAIRRRTQLVSTAAELLRESAPPDQRPNSLTAEASVGAVWGVLHHQVVHGQAHRLPSIAASLSFLATAPAVGAPTAARAIREEQRTLIESQIETLN